MFELALRRYDDPIAAGLVSQVQAEYVTRYGGTDAAVVDPAEFAPPRGLARAALARLETTAVRDGIRRLLLNTGPEQPEAIALYESSGYRPTAPFGHYSTMPGALFYGKDLGHLPMAGLAEWSERATPA